MTLLPPLRWRRVAFFTLAIAMAVSTHWPRLDLGDSDARPDLYIHVAAFALWNALLTVAAFFGPAASGRNIAISAAVAAVYAAIDEWTQQFFQRSTNLDDLLANLAGVALGAFAGWGAARFFGHASDRPGASGQSATAAR